MKYEAIIFDFDGVIGNTMEDNYRAWSKAFGQYAVFLHREEYFLLEGMDLRAVAESILSRRGKDSVIAGKIAQLKEQYYIEDNFFEFYPGVLELIDVLREHLKLALASSANSQRLKKCVSKSFLQKFESVVTGDVVKNLKPHPEPYLTASKDLCIPAPQCLAVENAPMGIESAKAAQMDCVAICSTLDRIHLARADFILDHIGLLNEFLKI